MRLWWRCIPVFLFLAAPCAARAGYLPQAVSPSVTTTPRGLLGEIAINQRPALSLSLENGGPERLSTITQNLQNALAQASAPPSASQGGQEQVVVMLGNTRLFTVTNADLALWRGQFFAAQPTARGVTQARLIALVVEGLNKALQTLPSLRGLPEKLYLGVGEQETFPLLQAGESPTLLPTVQVNEGQEYLGVNLDLNGQLTLQGLGVGEGLVVIQKGLLREEVWFKTRFRAGLVTGPMRLFLSNPAPSRHAVLDMARSAIAANVFEREGAETTLHFNLPSPLPTRNTSIPVTVLIQGQNYFDVRQQAQLQITTGQLTPMQPARLYMSNSPERVKGPQRLFEGVLGSGAPVRFMLHHLNDSPHRQLYSVKVRNTGDRPVSLYTQGASGGPSQHETFVGYACGLAFFREMASGAGLGLTIAPGSQAHLYRYPMKPRDVISAVYNMEAVGGDLELIVDAYHDAANGGVATQLENTHPELVFSYADMPQEVEHLTSASWKYLPLGYLPESAGTNHHHIKGNFGGMDSITVKFRNDEEVSRKVWIKFFPAAGYAGGVFYINREITSVKPTPPPQEVMLYRRELSPGESCEVSLQSLTLPGSNYPAKLIVAAEPRAKVVRQPDGQ